MIEVASSGRTNSSHGITVTGVTAFKVNTSAEYKRKNIKVSFTVAYGTNAASKNHDIAVQRKLTVSGNKLTFRYDGWTYDITKVFPTLLQELKGN